MPASSHPTCTFAVLANTDKVQPLLDLISHSMTDPVEQPPTPEPPALRGDTHQAYSVPHLKTAMGPAAVIEYTHIGAMCAGIKAILCTKV
jgi:hypothetical protein